MSNLLAMDMIYVVIVRISFIKSNLQKKVTYCPELYEVKIRLQFWNGVNIPYF